MLVGEIYLEEIDVFGEGMEDRMDYLAVTIFRLSLIPS